MLFERVEKGTSNINRLLKGENIMKRNFHARRQLSSGLSLNILTDDELDEIHYGNLEMLNETGVL